MMNKEKQTRIRHWMDPEEQVTVPFLDAPDRNVIVTNGTDRLANISIETHLPDMPQIISVPLSRVEVAEDFSHYTRDPEQPFNNND